MNAVISASAVLAGVVISLLGNWFLSWLKEGHERKKLLRSKYEELAFLLVESVGDYQKILVAESNRQLLKDSQLASAQKMFAYAQLYFPELLAATDGYLSELVAFRTACACAAADQPDKPWPEALASSPKVSQAQEALNKAKGAFQDQILTYTKSYTKI